MFHPLGHHRFACLALLVAAPLVAFCSFDSSDSATLDNINLNLYSLYRRVDDSIGSTSDFQNFVGLFRYQNDGYRAIGSLIDIDQPIKHTEATLVGVSNVVASLNAFFASTQGNDKRLGDYPNPVQPAVHVVSDGINSRLDKIIDLMTNGTFSAGSGFTNMLWALPLTGFDPYGYPSWSSNDFNSYMRWILSLLDNYASTCDPGWLQQLFAYSGSWRDTPTAMLSLIYKHPSIFVGKKGNNLYRDIVRELLPYSDASGANPQNPTYAEIYYREYGTFDLTQNVSNFLYSTVIDGKTNDAVMAAITSPAQFQAFFNSPQFTNTLSKFSASAVPGSETFPTFTTNGVSVALPSSTSSIDLTDITANTNNDYTTPFTKFVSQVTHGTEFDDTFKTDLDSGYNALNPFTQLSSSASGILVDGFTYGQYGVEDYYIFPNNTEIKKWGVVWIDLARVMMWVSHLYIIIYLMESFLWPGQDRFLVPSGPNGELRIVNPFDHPDLD